VRISLPRYQPNDRRRTLGVRVVLPDDEFLEVQDLQGREGFQVPLRIDEMARIPGADRGVEVGMGTREGRQNQVAAGPERDDDLR